MWNTISLLADYIIRSIQNNRERTYVDDIIHRITFNNNPSLTLDVPGNRNINEDLKRSQMMENKVLFVSRIQEQNLPKTCLELFLI